MPCTLVRFARVAAACIGLAMIAGYVGNSLTLESAALGSFALAVALLLAVPDQRSSELLAAAAIWLTTGEFLTAVHDGHFAVWRWLVAIATVGMVLVSLKVQYLRMLARSNPYRTIGDLDRRARSTGVLPLGAATAAEARSFAPAGQSRREGSSPAA